MKLLDIKPKVPSNLLVDKFIVPPFSILDTRQGYWVSRKQKWKSIGIQSELGRGDSILFTSENVKDFDNYRHKNIDEKYAKKTIQGTSIFDPVLCELAYKWFSRYGDDVIDPFAGGSVRGVVASALGRNYLGIDLSESQIKHNKHQFKEIVEKYDNEFKPINWQAADSLEYTNKIINTNKYNFMFTCPPYYNLEVYSEDAADISNMATYEEFIDTYSKILTNCVKMLENDSFAVIVVGNMRDKKTGAYHDFQGDTIRIMQEAWCLYYNELILVNVSGTLPIRAPKAFNATRKIGKQHQNVLVFYKGDVKNISEKFGELCEDNI